MKINKFRAWDVENQEMIDADSLAFDFYKPLCDQLRDSDEIKFMQFTGLLDKNNKEVYEKDILRVKMGCSWQEKLFLVEDIWDLHIWLNDKDLYLRVKSFEVVGNIYQNADLIGKY